MYSVSGADPLTLTESVRNTAEDSKNIIEIGSSSFRCTVQNVPADDRRWGIQPVLRHFP